MSHARRIVVPAVFQDAGVHVVGQIGNAANDKIANTEAACDAELWINVTDANGGTLQNISIQASSKSDDADPSNDDQWSEVGTLANITTAGAFRLALNRGVNPLGRRMRLRGEIITADMTFEAILLIRE